MHFILLLLFSCRGDLLVLPLQYHTVIRMVLDRKHINNSLWSHCSPNVIWLESLTVPLRDRDCLFLPVRKVLIVISEGSWGRLELEKVRKCHIYSNSRNLMQELCNHIKTEQLKHSKEEIISGNQIILLSPTLSPFSAQYHNLLHGLAECFLLIGQSQQSINYEWQIKMQSLSIQRTVSIHLTVNRQVLSHTLFVCLFVFPTHVCCSTLFVG